MKVKILSQAQVAQIEKIIDRALAEDVSQGDITTETLISHDWRGMAYLIIKANGILAGVDVAKEVFLRVDPELEVEVLIADGSKVQPGDMIIRISGRIHGILKAERTALNFLQRLSGIASETYRYVEAVEGLPVHIMDTRKTTPGLRLLEKYAVKVGGGKNHRMNLGDGILIKDNHLAVLRSQGLSIKEIVAQVRRSAPLSLRGIPGRSKLKARQTQIEVEVKTVQEASEAADAGADIIMLDNMSIENMRKAIELISLTMSRMWPVSSASLHRRSLVSSSWSNSRVAFR
ncbi:MAG: carboxylating nicotinate-nucleotide diphosphorylase [Chloroflexota bacterium]|nr:carboxylating nicotinate-nucleotide diphosphorylase [Chloroflexota bacterium]